MRQFIRTITPTEGYQKVKQVGKRYVVHLEGVASEDGITTCYECMTDSEPDFTVLSQELQEYKAYRAERDLELAKKVKIQALMAYDSSSAVNEFSYDGVPMWLDKATRAGLLLRFQSEKTLGETETTLWFETFSFTLQIDTAFMLLFAIEKYASACFDNTALHKKTIEQLQTKEEVEAYDFTTGYPEKPRFNT